MSAARTFGPARRETRTETPPPSSPTRISLDAWEQTDEELLRRIRSGSLRRVVLIATVWEARRRGIY